MISWNFELLRVCYRHIFLFFFFHEYFTEVLYSGFYEILIKKLDYY